MTERHPPLRDPHLEEVAHWHPIEGTPEKKKVAISSGIGATIEAYDFIGYGTAAALYFSPDFFPSGDPLTGTLLSFATLGVGFLVRPLGGVIGGYLGDKVGRKPVLVASLMLMGLATVLHRPAAHLPERRHLGRHPARPGPRRPGPGLRRRMGRRDPDDLRTRPLAHQGQVHRHRPGRLPRRAAAGQPGLPGHRPPARHLGLAGAVPAVHRAGHRRPDHPLQDPRVPRLRRGQGPRRDRQEPASPRSSATTGGTSCAASACASPRPPATPSPSPSCSPTSKPRNWPTTP